MELFFNNGTLISEQEWHAKITALRSEVEEKIQEDRTKGRTYEQLKEELKTNIFKAIQQRIPAEPFGIFFSGGLDSTTIAFICKLLEKEFTCYNVGFKEGMMQDAPDFIEARKGAEQLEIPLVAKQYGLDEAETIIQEVIAQLPTPATVDADYVVKIGVAAVVVAARRIAIERIFFSGLGSEEIFAGYQRHERAHNINDECWRGLFQMWSRDLVRDCTIARHLGIDVRTPFLDRDVIVTALRIDGKRKVRDGHKKVVLREIAEELGLSREQAWRKKMGAQYGSRFDTALEKLAKKYAHSYKRDYLATTITTTQKQSY